MHYATTKSVHEALQPQDHQSIADIACRKPAVATGMMMCSTDGSCRQAAADASTNVGESTNMQHTVPQHSSEEPAAESQRCN